MAKIRQFAWEKSDFNEFTFSFDLLLIERSKLYNMNTMMLQENFPATLFSVSGKLATNYSKALKTYLTPDDEETSDH